MLTTGKWIAYASINNKYKHLGTFKLKEEALTFRHKFLFSIFGDFYRFDQSQRGCLTVFEGRV